MKINPISTSIRGYAANRTNDTKHKITNYGNDSLNFKAITMKQPKMKFGTTKALTALFTGIGATVLVPAAIIGAPFTGISVCLTVASGAIVGLCKDYDEYLHNKRKYKHHLMQSQKAQNI